MPAWIEAFGPTFALIALGALLRARLLRDPAAWAGLEALTFWVLLPSLLCAAISTIDLARLPLGAAATAIWSALALGTVAALAGARIARLPAPAATSVLQGVIRFNNFTAFSIVGGLYGAPGIALGGVAAGLMTTVIQLIVTATFAIAGAGRIDPLRVARQIALNPIILGCLLGFAFAAAGGMPAGIGGTVRALGGAAVAIGLLCVGAALAPASLRERSRLQGLVAVAKLVALPLVTLTVARALALDPLLTAVAVMFMAMPTAPTAYVQARMMGGDTRLMAATITLQHVAAIATLPSWAWLLGR